jgi:hypothetical protein
VSFHDAVQVRVKPVLLLLVRTVEIHIRLVVLHLLFQLGDLFLDRLDLLGYANRPHEYDPDTGQS